MTENQFDNLASILLEQTTILKIIREELRKISNPTKYVVGMDLAPGKDRAVQVLPFVDKAKDKLGHIAAFDPETAPKCPEHRVYLERGKWRMVCPYVGCIHSEPFPEK